MGKGSTVHIAVQGMVQGMGTCCKVPSSTEPGGKMDVQPISLFSCSLYHSRSWCSRGFPKVDHSGRSARIVLEQMLEIK